MTRQELLKLLGVPESPDDMESYLDGWQTLVKAQALLRVEEMEQRKKLFAFFFPNPKEGTNTVVLPDGRKVKGSFKITRGIDDQQVSLARAEYQLVNNRPVEFDDLLRVKYDLSTTEFRKIQPKPGEEPSAAYLAASRMIIAKPGSPSLEIE